MQVPVMNPVVRLEMHTPIVTGQPYQTARDPSARYISPRPIIVSGPVPAPFKGSVPKSLIKKNIRFDIRDAVHIGPRYHDQVGGTVDNKLRRRNINPGCICSGRKSHGTDKNGGDHHQQYSSLFHFILLYSQFIINALP
jgi:hypothetical protein